MDSGSGAPPAPHEHERDNPQQDGDELRGGSAAPVQEGTRVEVSAATITRMMGIAAVSDIKLLEGRIDLLTAKVVSMMAKLDKIVSTLASMPAASDIDRLEIQIGTLKSLVREVLEEIPSAVSPRTREKERAESQEQSRKLRESIKSSPDQD